MNFLCDQSAKHPYTENAEREKTGKMQIDALGRTQRKLEGEREEIEREETHHHKVIHK